MVTVFRRGRQHTNRRIRSAFTVDVNNCALLFTFVPTRPAHRWYCPLAEKFTTLHWPIFLYSSIRGFGWITVFEAVNYYVSEQISWRRASGLWIMIISV